MNKTLATAILASDSIADRLRNNGWPKLASATQSTVLMTQAFPEVSDDAKAASLTELYSELERVLQMKENP